MTSGEVNSRRLWLEEEISVHRRRIVENEQELRKLRGLCPHEYTEIKEYLDGGGYDIVEVCVSCHLGRDRGGFPNSKPWTKTSLFSTSNCRKKFLREK